jgi:hypothetical protein
MEYRNDCNNCRPSERTTPSFAEERTASNAPSVSTGPANRLDSTALSHRAAAKDTSSGSSRHHLRSAMPAALRLVERLRASPPPNHPRAPAASSITKRTSATAMLHPLYSRRAGLQGDAHPRNTDDMDLNSTSPRSAASQTDPTRLIQSQPQPPTGEGVCLAASSLQPFPGLNATPQLFSPNSSPAPEQGEMDCYEDSCGGGGDSCSSRGEDWMDLFSAWEEECAVPVQESLSPAPGMHFVLTNATIPYFPLSFPPWH